MLYLEAMLKGMVKLWGWRCGRCEHEWLPRNKEEVPRVCPKCKSDYWNKPRKNAMPEKKEEK